MKNFLKNSNDIIIFLTTAILIAGCATSGITHEPQGISSELKELMKRGMALEHEGKFDEARVLYEQVTIDYPHFPDVYARLGYTLQKLGYIKQAQNMFSVCKKMGMTISNNRESIYIPELYYGYLLTNGVIIPAPLTESELLKITSPARAIICSDDNYLTLVSTESADHIPIINNSPQIGIGSELRFDKRDFVDFIGGKYCKGGVSITESGVKFWAGTERLEQDSIYIFTGEMWVKSEQK